MHVVLAFANAAILFAIAKRFPLVALNADVRPARHGCLHKNSTCAAGAGARQSWHEWRLSFTALAGYFDDSSPSAIARSLVTVFQLRPVPGVMQSLSTARHGSLDFPMPSGK